MKHMVEQATAALESINIALSQLIALEKAATKLANEVAGCWSAYDLELRGVMGHTNFNCVAERLAELRTALNVPLTKG